MIIKRRDKGSTGEHKLIHLVGGGFAMVDPNLYDELSQFCWRAVKSQKCTYALRRANANGSVPGIRMHRLVANTPEGMDCHHINHNPLDNRRVNLMNLTPQRHKEIHHHSW